MARMSLQEVTSSAALLFPDNSTKLITPAKMRQFISELITAIRPAYGVISRVANVIQAITTTPAPVVLDTGALSPIVDYTLTPASGRIQRNEKGMTRLTFTCDILSHTTATGRTTTFTLFKNGVATSWRQSIVTNSITVIESLSFPAIEYLDGVAQYEIRVSIDVGTSMTFSNVSFVAETVPVWDYTV